MLHKIVLHSQKICSLCVWHLAHAFNVHFSSFHGLASMDTSAVNTIQFFALSRVHCHLVCNVECESRHTLRVLFQQITVFYNIKYNAKDFRLYCIQILLLFLYFVQWIFNLSFFALIYIYIISIQKLQSYNNWYTFIF